MTESKILLMFRWIETAMEAWAAQGGLGSTEYEACRLDLAAAKLELARLLSHAGQGAQPSPCDQAHQRH